jgi:hypothetical protein
MAGEILDRSSRTPDAAKRPVDAADQSPVEPAPSSVRGQVQMRAGRRARPAAVHEVAAIGTQGSGASLPHLAAIQRSFGRHDVTGVVAHIGGDAAVACDQLGALAYASGSRVAFRSDPDLHTAAHEAAHVVQQRGGVSVPGGVGAVGDRYEQHADAVADAVVAGGSAEELLDQYGGGDAAASVQRKVNPVNPAYPGDPAVEVATCEGQAGDVLVPEPLPEGFGEYQQWITGSVPAKLAVVAEGRTALDAAIAPRKAAIEAGLETDLAQGVNIEKQDATLLLLYETNMNAVSDNAGEAGSHVAHALIAGEKLVAMNLKVAEDAEKAEKEAAKANDGKASKAGDTLVQDLIGLAGILAAFAATGGTAAGAASATLALKLTVVKKLGSMATLALAKDQSQAISAKWASVKAGIARGGVSDSSLRMIEALQSEVAQHKSDAEKNLTELKKALDVAMQALEQVELGKIDSVALRACEEYRAAVAAPGKAHFETARGAATSIGEDGWSEWQQ